MRYLLLIVGLAISTVCFAGGPVPTVTGVSPTSGPQTGGTSVTIIGSFFTGATAINFGRTPAASFIIINDTSATATDPAGTGTVDVTVTTPNGTSATSPADQFTYSAMPVTLQSFGVD
jgi:large repetitive protein